MKATLPYLLGVNGGYIMASVDFSSTEDELQPKRGKKQRSLQRLNSWSYILHFQVS
jgi:hypothetical protein